MFLKPACIAAIKHSLRRTLVQMNDNGAKTSGIKKRKSYPTWIRTKTIRARI